MKAKFWVAGLVGALVLVVFQQVRITRLQDRIAALEAPRAAPDRSRSAAASPRMMDDASEGRAAARIERKAGGRSADVPGAGDAEGDSTFGGSFRKMAENPAGRAMMNQGLKAMSAMWFADLSEDFGLSKEEEEFFIQLVAGGMSAQQQIGMKMMNAETPEERKALAEEIEAAKKETTQAVKDFLNNEEDFEAYEAYEKRLPERQQLEGLRAVMQEAEAPLTPGQEDRVIDAMYTARTTREGATDWNGTGGMEAIASGDAAARFEREWEESSRAVTEEVGKVLQGPQLDAFKGYQQQMKDMQLMGIKMAEKMFQPKSGDPGEP